MLLPDGATKTMKPDWLHSIEELLSNWETHTQDERTAIESQDWTGLATIQKSKELLMQSIDQIAEKNKHSEDDLGRWLSPKINDLLEMEKRNAELLSNKQNHARSEIEKSRTSGRQLNQIKSAYTVSRESVMIKSYS